MLDNRIPLSRSDRGHFWARLAHALAIAAVAALAALPAAGQAPPAPAKLSAADKANVGRIEQYLNSLVTLEAKFLQVSSTGEYSEGKLYLSRPGHLRIEYDPPVPILIVVRDGTLIYYDKQLEQVSYIDAGKTPAGLLVKKDVSLTSGDLVLTKFVHEADAFRVTLVRADDPLEGRVTLVLADRPMALKKWVVTDAQGITTTVSLLATRTGVTLDPKLFEFVDPNFFKDKQN